MRTPRPHHGTGKLFDVNRLFVALAAGIALLPAVAHAAEAPVDASSGVATDIAGQRGTILLDLTQVTKISADERFLEGDRAGAAALYEEAAAQLRRLESIAEAERPRLKFLIDDIRYRQALLKGGFEFWGVAYSTRPLNPVSAMTDFEADVGRLDTAVAELEALKTRITAADLSQLKTIAKQERAIAQANVQDLEKQKAVIADQYYDQRQSELHQRIDRLQNLQKELYEAQQVAEQELKAESSAANALLMQGIGEGLGVPADLQSIASSGGGLDKALLATASQLSGTPAFTEALGSMAEVTTMVSDVYAQSVKIQQKVQQYSDAAEQLSGLVRTPTIGKFMALGQQLYAASDPATRAKLESLITEAKPLVPLLEIARTRAPLANALRTWVSQSPDLDKAFAVTRIIDGHKADLAQFYAATMQQMLATDIGGPATTQIVDRALRDWSDKLFDLIPPAAQPRLLHALGVASRGEAVAALRQKGMQALPMTIVNGRLTIPSATIDIDLAQMAQQLDPASLPSAEALLNKTVETGLSQIAGQEPRVMEALFKDITAEQLEIFVGRHLKITPTDSGAIFDSLLQLAPDARAGVVGDLAALQAGVVGAQQQSEAIVGPQLAAGPIASAQPQAQAGGVDALNAALTGPLGAAFPQAKVAMIAAKWVAGNLNMMSKIDQINGISEQIQRYVVEEMHLRDSVEEAQFRQELALVEQRIADERHDDAIKAVQQQQQQIDTIARTEAELRARIVKGYRIAQIFFLAERVRYRFDILNRALRTWTGAYAGGTDYIVASSLANPNNLRLALDPRIELFTFLNDKDAERQRSDLDALVVSWKMMLSVAQTVCGGPARGCTTNNPKLGPVDFTPTFRLKALLPPAEWQEFEAWQAKKAPGIAFRTAFFMHPAGVGPSAEIQFPASGHLVLRVVDVGATRIDRYNREAISSVRLSHPGVAYIENSQGYYVESLGPVSGIGGLPQIAKMGGVADYEKRWGLASGGRMGAFEGYGLLSEWFIEIPGDPDSWSMKDLQLRFAYQYQDNLPKLEMNGKDEILGGQSTPIFLPPTQLEMLGTTVELEAKLARWSADKDQPWLHGARLDSRQPWMADEPATVQRLRDWIN